MAQKQTNIPAWMITYADLMSLLLCFFVLLLSFAEIDAEKFRRVADELSKAFGVQREVEAMQVPMGTSAVKQHFSPAVPDRTLIDEVRQQTTQQKPQLESVRNVLETQRHSQSLQLAQNVEKLLETSLPEGAAEIDIDQFRVVVRISENGTFGSGNATVTSAFEDLLQSLATLLADVPGTISIDGHTDDVPIRTSHFRSNWDLSAMRAASVANVLTATGALASERLIVQGFADTRPLASNLTNEGRAKNRRVELMIDLDAAIEERGERSVESLQPVSSVPVESAETDPSP
ncbi:MULTISPECIES: flagellar motor protein MotB [unclassified Halomonas]|uniref:flagellar motor protein MotB n=1 Tax=unclassified Halomonas TaxID=2609666 RepID=UPI0007D8D546|nr:MULTISPECIES: flagellar motor protein MotB [unclassified Halomonas]MBT2785365.1 OmpA family protein [Halomonas sp. ISL-106]MBT2799386.1 OmpA family protein [Halomonas sp. ISL-104]OAL59639.1 flagellar motor protein MotB [Halomonas sp. ALS9]